MNFIIRAVVIAIALLAIGVAYLRSLPADIVAIGAPVRQDDFLYTVTRVEKRPATGAIAYVVTIRVDNQAKRVDYRWRDDSVFVTDSAGRHYGALVAEHATAQERPPITAGLSSEYTVTFVLPPNADHPMLHYWNGILMGDVFNLGAYGRAAVPL